MKKWFVSVGLVFVFLISLCFFTGATNDQAAEHEKFVPNEVLVKFKEDTGKHPIQAAIDSVQGKVITYQKKEIAAREWNAYAASSLSFPGDPYLFHLRVPEFIGTEAAISLLKTNANVEYADKNGILHLCVIPDDEHFPKLWGMRNIGQTGGTVDADIDAPEAWDVFTGSPDVVVAVLDTGIQYNHTDLQDNIWINTNEIPGNSIDDDGNGYIDDYQGWDFYSGDNDPMDTYRHGTHVAGTIGVKANNNREGVAGVCWTVKLMALRCGPGPGIDIASAINAIDYAKDMNARVINASWGSGGKDSYSQSLYNAINRAQSKGVLFVAAAGNYQWGMEWYDNDDKPVYPASYNLNNVLAVLSTDHNDNLSPFSHYGKTSVDMGAPGGTGDGTIKDIYSTIIGGTYGYSAGTSMATPHVAGVAALAIGKCPPITYSQLKSRLMANVDFLASLNNKCVSNGRVNAYKVIFDPEGPSAPGNLGAVPTGWTTIKLTWTDNSTNEIGFEVQRKAPGMPDHAYLKSADANQTFVEDWTAVAGQTFFYKLRAYNMASLSGFANEVSATIPIGSPQPASGLNAFWDWGQGAVQLAWTDMSNNEEHFYIERKSEWESLWTQIAELGQDYVSHYDSDVAGDTFYFYRVKVANPIGDAYSGIVQVYVPQY